jgi:7-carboxy-7-deazaguanine synthase
MRVSEVFHSLQGEGELTGVPSVFIRTSGCNLRCAWCDTKYASWHPEGETVSVQQLVAEALRHPVRHVVLTGGEPMIAPELPELARRLHEAGLHITIETAGTVAPAGIACDLASISPKLANSTPAAGEIAEAWRSRHDALRLQPEVLGEWLAGYDFQLKFVVAGSEDLTEIERLLAALPKRPPPHKVLLMPEGTDLPTLEARRPLLVRACKERGYRYCERLHVALFGHARGT